MQWFYLLSAWNSPTLPHLNSTLPFRSLPFILCDPHNSSHPQGKFVRSPSFSLFVASTVLYVYVCVCMCVKMQIKATVNTHHISLTQPFFMRGKFSVRKNSFHSSLFVICVCTLKCHMITQFIVENCDIYQFKRCTEWTVTQCHCDINLFLFCSHWISNPQRYRILPNEIPKSWSQSQPKCAEMIGTNFELNRWKQLALTTLLRRK